MKMSIVNDKKRVLFTAQVHWKTKHECKIWTPDWHLNLRISQMKLILATK